MNTKTINSIPVTLILLFMLISCNNNKLLSGYILLPQPKAEDSLNHVTGQRVFQGTPVKSGGLYKVIYERSYDNFKDIVDARTGTSLDVGLKKYFGAKLGFTKKKIRIQDFKDVKISTLDFSDYNISRGDKVIFQTIVIGGFVIKDTINNDIKTNISVEEIKTQLGDVKAQVDFNGQYGYISFKDGKNLAIAIKAVEIEDIQDTTKTLIFHRAKELDFKFLNNHHSIRFESSNLFSTGTPEIINNVSAHRGCLNIIFQADVNTGVDNYNPYCPEDSMFRTPNCPAMVSYRPNEIFQKRMIRPGAPILTGEFITTYLIRVDSLDIAYKSEDLMNITDNYKIQTLNAKLTFMVNRRKTKPIKKLNLN